MKDDLRELITQFNIKDTIGKTTPFGNGHINDSIRLINEDDSGGDYLMQKINHHVFKNVHGMMNNIELVTAHLRRNIILRGGDVDSEVLTLIHTCAGRCYLKVDSGYWRCFRFIKELKAHDFSKTSKQAYEGAKAFGNFLKYLSDFPIEKLHYTIPDFHNMKLRIKQFDDALSKSDQYLISEASQQISYVKNMADIIVEIQDQAEKGKLPLRVTHNDTKFNNVLLNEDDEGICVIDLDTVMPGIVHYDFGDGIRTGAVTAEEDEPDLSKVDVDMVRFEAFTAGYLEATREILTEEEINTLSKAPMYMAFMMGLRFLTDYLSGDKYYKVSFPGQNLIRAKCQLQLSKIFQSRNSDFERIIKINCK